ncbi:hypothetical protein FGO68_gene15118 [Halteria grandinella]|uniref:DUF1731 domain-containing protein n=1 Tax=Halteria grandinella TaxID=5974 RepID=A0A8J8NB58_HALGN|nr:hypothetical protein FGO68_gene15118 [Halteria grandinella]
MNICKMWEMQFFAGNLLKTRKVALRTSIVLGNEGGAFPKLRAITKIGLGGKQGSGNQMISWIHYLDFCRAVEYIIDNTEIQGAINLTSPNPVKNEDFMQKLRKGLGVSFGLNSPEFLLKIASFFLRTEPELLLKSRNVYPAILLEKGFKFEFLTIEKAFNNLIYAVKKEEDQFVKLFWFKSCGVRFKPEWNEVIQRHSSLSSLRWFACHSNGFLTSHLFLPGFLLGRL